MAGTFRHHLGGDQIKITGTFFDVTTDHPHHPPIHDTSIMYRLMGGHGSNLGSEVKFLGDQFRTLVNTRLMSDQYASLHDRCMTDEIDWSTWNT